LESWDFIVIIGWRVLKRDSPFPEVDATWNGRALTFTPVKS